MLKCDVLSAHSAYGSITSVKYNLESSSLKYGVFDKMQRSVLCRVSVLLNAVVNFAKCYVTVVAVHWNI